MILSHAKTFVVSERDAGSRLDVFVSQASTQSRAQITKYIKSGLVLVNDKLTKSSYVTQINDVVKVAHIEAKKTYIEPQNLPLDIIYSDEHIALINKAKGMVVHPGAGVRDGTLVHALLYHFPDMNVGNVERPGIVHRLDKDTSGILVIAKTHEAHQRLSADFKGRRVKKIYRVFCHGEIAAKKFELKTGHARHPYNRLRFLTKLPAPQLPSVNVRFAHTEFEVVSQRWGVCEIKAILHTGRTHQIRAHLADIDHPLINDEVYGGARALGKGVPQELAAIIGTLRGQALHAETLEFAHPITGQNLVFSAPLPENYRALSELLR